MIICLSPSFTVAIAEHPWHLLCWIFGVSFNPGGGRARLEVASHVDEVSLEDELFFSLDGQLLVVGEAQWHVEVCGVHSSATEHWVQLALSGPLQTALTVRTATLDASSVLREVSDWIGRGYSHTGKAH